ncbi:MAG: DUF2341 domain-containing protein, partial [Candidatus Hodarchaeales archaeon]
MKNRRIVHNWILFLILTINFFITGFVIGGNFFNTEQNELDLSNSVNLNEKGNISTLVDEEEIHSKWLTNIDSPDFQDNDNQIKISSGKENSANQRTNPNFLILNEGQPWTQSTFKYRKAIRIDSSKVSGTGSLNNFPIVLELFDEDLHDDVQANGNDIVFTDFNGNKLDHEIDLFEQSFSSTQAHLIAWIKIPSLSATSDTTIFMYFGDPIASAQENPTGVWSSSYVGVWHLNETGTGVIDEYADSSPSSNNGQGGEGQASYVPTRTTGKIGYGQDFDGTDDIISLTTSSSLQPSSVTFSAWLKRDVSWNDQRFPIFWAKGGPWNGDGFYIQIDDLSNGPTTNRDLLMVVDGSNFFMWRGGDPDDFYPLNEWSYVTVTFDSSTNQSNMYFNGLSQSLQTFGSPSTITSTADTKYIAKTGEAFPGHMDEVRVINTVRSASWIETEFNNQNDPTDFYALGSKHTQKFWPVVDYSFRKNLTIDSSVVSGSSDLINFPYLLEFYDSDLRYKTLSTGYDILFTDKEGVPYDFELGEFNQNFNSTHAFLSVWIKIPILSASTNTELVMYYGNPTAQSSPENPAGVWDENYMAVFHFDECCITPSDVPDSTVNGKILRRIPPSGMNSNDWITAKIGNGLDFDGNNDGLNATSTTSIDDFTISTWFKADATDGWRSIVSIGENRDFTLLNNYLVFDNGGSTENFGSSAPISTGTWYYATIVATGSFLLLYVNGVQKPAGSLSLGPYTDRIAVGYWPSIFGADYFNGIIDEVRVSNSVRSGDWTKTEYNNQLNPSNYLSRDEEEQFINIFDYRKQITIDQNQISGSSEIRDLPIYFDFNDSDIRTKAQTNGTDIYFADNNGTRLLHEFIEYTDNGSHIQVKTWIRANKIQPTIDTTIYMYYGNSDIDSLEANIGVGQGVFDAIYHLDETATDEQNSVIHTDSANGYNANQDGNEGVKGIIDGAQKFDGIDDQLIINSSWNLNPTDNFTISGWFKLESTFDGTTPSLTLVTRRFDSYNNFHIILVGTDYKRTSDPVGLANMPNGSLVVKIERDPSDSDTWYWTNRTTWTAGVWYHFVYTAHSTGASNNKIYINGMDDTDNDYVVESENENINYVSDWGIGGGIVDGSQFDVTDSYFTGSIDEIRLISEYKGNNWAQTEYNSINDPQGMYSIGNEGRNFPYLQDLGVYDPGDGFPQYWANITGGWQGSINSATIEVDSTPFSMSYNGTYWVYAPAGVVFNMTYSYQITNATNTLGQYLQTTSTLESYTSDKDVIDPTIDGTPQYDGSTINDGIFRVNITDSWGSIDDVIVTILDHSDPTTCGGSCYSPTSAVMQNNSIEFVNDSINLFKGTVTYQIVVNDTVGNTFVSGNQTANVLNKIPNVSNITLTPISLKSSDTLVLSYDYFDPENAVNASIDTESGTEIRWYLNGTHQSAYDDSLTIPPAALSLYDIWNVSVRSKDGNLFGDLQWYTGPQVIVSNSAPEASDLVITPALPTNTSDLTADWTFFDEDGDTQPADSWIIRWYNNISGFQSAYNDSKTVPAAVTTKDQKWWYTLYVYDGFQYSIEYTSPNKTIVNSAPIASNVAIEGSPRTTDFLNATWDYSDADFDSEISFTLRWYMDNGSGFIYQSQFENIVSINPSFTERDQVWNFTLEVFDGTNYSILYTSPTKTIINSAPTASSLIITSNPDTTLDLVANWTYTDVDNDAQSTSWRVRWYRDGILVSSFNDLLTVPAGYTNKSEVWNYTVQVFDSTEYSILYYSTSTTIQNTAPVVTSVSLTPFSPNATSSQDLQVSWTYSDIDNDPENVSAVQIRWYRNGVLAPLFNDSIGISYQNTTRDDEWYFEVWAFDGESYSSFNSSNPVTIINSLPSFLSQPTFNNTSPGENEDFNITLSNYHDEDDDVIQNVTVYWF